MPDINPELTIIKAIELTDELYQACQRLVPQLTNSHPQPTHDELAMLLSSPSSTLFIAKLPDFGQVIIGMATLIIYRIPTGLRAYIEDVVVDERVRGNRIGEALTRACLERAHQAGATQAMLTSNPSRIAANKLYQRMGFKLHKTNVYSYDLNRGR